MMYYAQSLFLCSCCGCSQRVFTKSNFLVSNTFGDSYQSRLNKYVNNLNSHGLLVFRCLTMRWLVEECDSELNNHFTLVLTLQCLFGCVESPDLDICVQCCEFEYWTLPDAFLFLLHWKNHQS